ncbi:hypothetical protein MMC25_005636 [Agyrium rufum]|nr:hypothetical protein [Agyrium rufum]
MALASGRIFNFFDVAYIKAPDEEQTSLFNNNDPRSVCSGSGSLFFGTNDGQVKIISESLKAVKAFQAHDAGSVTFMKQVKDTAFLVTISEDLSNDPVLKVWALDRLEKNGSPKCLSSLAVSNGRKQFPISAFAALDDLSQLAVGFANGAVTLIRGDLIHDRGAKQRTVFESEEPITGVEFRVGLAVTTLYLTTTGRILTLTISGRGQGQPAKPLDDTGCGVGCMTIEPESGDIIVVRDDAVYYYGTSGRKPSYPYEGPKRLVRTFNQYVALLCLPNPTQTTKTGFSRLFGGSNAQDVYNPSTFAILDTDLKYVAYTEQINGEIKSMFVEWGDIFVITQDGKLFRYREKPLQQKLEILYQRDMYVFAINLAQKAKLEPAKQNIILRRYGDYLYQKGDFDTAMQQYLKAINNTEPSQVIRKFLDTQRIHNLIEYLEELHGQDKATVDHTTLLLNCYAKLKDTEKLEAFIESDNNFDFDTAVTMCRQGGYYEQAVYLAKKHGEHDLVVDILIEDSKDYQRAMNYIWRLEPEIAYPNLMKYARVLLEHCPNDATQVFIDYYTSTYRPKQETIQESIPIQDPAFYSGMANAIPNLSSFIPLAYRPLPSVASPETNGSQQLALDQNEAAEVAAAAEPLPAYKVPKPRTAFSAFVDHPVNFVIFLESCLKQEHIDEADKVDLYTTLFEMYLETASTKKGSERNEWEMKAKKLIEGQHIPIDASNVLLLSHLSNFEDGTVLVREQQGLRFDIFRSYTTANDTAGAIKALRKYGSQEPQLYPAALAYFTSSSRILEEAGGELDAVLRKIDIDGLMAPLQVIQTLSANGVATMGMVKKYLSDTVEQERKEISNNRRLIESYRGETASKRAEIQSLSTKPTTFMPNRCAACGGSLNLPTVHFLCKHSFHQRCLTQVDDNAECPQCSKQNATIRAIRRAQEDSADRHEMFQEALKRSREKFGTIGEFFGRGVMGASGVGE